MRQTPRPTVSPLLVARVGADGALPLVVRKPPPAAPLATVFPDCALRRRWRTDLGTSRTCWHNESPALAAIPFAGAIQVANHQAR